MLYHKIIHKVYTCSMYVYYDISQRGCIFLPITLIAVVMFLLGRIHLYEKQSLCKC